MKILSIDYDYYEYPQNINSLEEFIRLLETSNSAFIKLTQFQTENCCYPYFVKEDVSEIYLNISKMDHIQEEEVTVLTREVYDARLRKIVASKCVHCEQYSEDCEGDNLTGHRSMISLDGECSMFRKAED